MLSRKDLRVVAGDDYTVCDKCGKSLKAIHLITVPCHADISYTYPGLGSFLMFSGEPKTVLLGSLLKFIKAPYRFN